MRRMIVVTAAAMTLLSGQARPATTVYYHAGNWQAFSGTNAQNRLICGIGTASAPDGSNLDLTYDIGGNTLTITATKPSWSIPDGTTVPVIMVVGSNAPWNVQATGHGKSLSWTLDPASIRTFDPQFRVAESMGLSFPSGNEPPWTVPLVGSDAADNTFARCITDLTRQMQARAAPPTQPYGQPPTQPFGAAPGPVTAPPASPTQGAPTAPPQTPPATQ